MIITVMSVELLLLPASVFVNLLSTCNAVEMINLVKAKFCYNRIT